MKILALYDIHGNVDALDAVLADPRAQGADAVVIGGDTVPGRFALAALERLEAIRAPLHWVRGNGEREVGAAATGEVDRGDAAAAIGDADPGDAAAAIGDADPGDASTQTAALSAEEIGPQRAAVLGATPLTVELDGVLFCHASPRRDDEMLTLISAPERWRAALTGTAAALVVAGHTHQQDDRTVGSVRFVNAGSVGLPYEGDSAARWLWVADGVPELRRTTYDARAAGTRILAAGWPDRDSVEAALIDPIDPSIITRLFEDSVCS